MLTPAASARDGLAHRQRIAGVKAAGEAGRLHQRQQARVVAHAPDAVAFAEIGVEIEFSGGGGHGSGFLKQGL